MAATRTPGITIDPDGNYFIDKLHRGTRICQRLGPAADAAGRMTACASSELTLPTEAL